MYSFFSNGRSIDPITTKMCFLHCLCNHGKVLLSLWNLKETKQMEIASVRCAFHCHLQKVHVSCAQHWHNIVKMCVLFLLYSNVDVK